MKFENESYQINTKHVTKIYSFSALIWIIIVGIVGYFWYGSIDGGLATILLGAGYWFGLFVTFIPVAGLPLYWVLQAFAIEPLIFGLTGIEASALSNVMYWISFTVGIVINGITTLVIAAFLLRD